MVRHGQAQAVLAGQPCRAPSHRPVRDVCYRSHSGTAPALALPLRTCCLILDHRSSLEREEAGPHGPSFWSSCAGQGPALHRCLSVVASNSYPSDPAWGAEPMGRGQPHSRGARSLTLAQDMVQAGKGFPGRGSVSGGPHNPSAGAGGEGGCCS